MDKKISIYSDGGSRGNPGPAASAFVVLSNNKVIYKHRISIGISTNNYAEYYALYIALEWLLNNYKKNSFSKVDFYSDSELMVKQMKGIYKVKNKNIKGIYTSANQIIIKLPFELNFIHIERERNKYADNLVNISLDENN